MSRARRVAVVLALVAIVLAVGAAPFMLMLLPNPSPVAIRDVAEQLPGTYIQTGSATYHVFPRAEQVATFPADSLVAGPDAVFVVKYRQLADLSAYQVTTFEGAREVAVDRDTTAAKLLRLRPRQPLAPGRYVVRVPRESIYGGDDFVYFAVKPGSTTEATGGQP